MALRMAGTVVSLMVYELLEIGNIWECVHFFPGKEPVWVPGRGVVCGAFTSSDSSDCPARFKAKPHPLASSRCPPLRPSYIKTRELLLERTPSYDQIFKGVLHSLKS